MEERLQKILSQWGVASRREAEGLILARRVRCNGVVVQLGQKADPQKDLIQLMELSSRCIVRLLSIFYLISLWE